MDIKINFENFNKEYSVGDSISGTIILKNKKQESKYNLSLVLEGTFILSNRRVQPPLKIKELFLSKYLTLVSNGDLLKGSNTPTVYFKFPLIPESSNEKFYETYRGVVVSVMYEFYCNIKLNNIESYSSEKIRINITVPGMGIDPKFGTKLVPYFFSLTQNNIESNQLQNRPMPQFNIECFINNINCNFEKPFDGYIIIHNCSVEIKSIELQFLRHEQTNINGVNVNEISEIQNLQIGDGDVNKNIEIPLFMIFPKSFSCATLIAGKTKVSFEMTIMVVLVDGVVIMDNFPVNLWRG